MVKSDLYHFLLEISPEKTRDLNSGQSQPSTLLMPFFAAQVRLINSRSKYLNRMSMATARLVSRGCRYDLPWLMSVCVNLGVLTGATLEACS